MSANTHAARMFERKYPLVKSPLTAAFERKYPLVESPLVKAFDRAFEQHIPPNGDDQRDRIKSTKDRRIAVLETRCEKLDLEVESLSAQLERERQVRGDLPEPPSAGWFLD